MGATEVRRLRSQTARGGTGFLQAIPASFRAHINSVGFRVIMQRRLHQPLPLLMAETLGV